MTDSTDYTTPLELVRDDPLGGDDFARRIGLDARRVARGELSERDFYDRYHDDVVARFGFDRRPVEESR